MARQKGHHNDGRGAGTQGGTSRGSVKNASRLDTLKGRDGKGSAEWSSCDAELLQAVVAGITAMGGAITLGLSRDQGAHSLTLLLDDTRATLWFNGDADLDAELREVLAYIEEM